MRGLDFELSTNRKPRFRMSKFKIEFENSSFDLISSFWTHSKVIPRLFWVIWQSFSIVLLICIILMSSYHYNVILSIWCHSIIMISFNHSDVIISFLCHSIDTGLFWTYNKEQGRVKFDSGLFHITGAKQPRDKCKNLSDAGSSTAFRNSVKTCLTWGPQEPSEIQ